MEGIKEFWNTGIGKVIITGILGSSLLVGILLGIVLIRNNTPESPSESEQDLSTLQTQVTETVLEPQTTATSIPTETPLPTDNLLLETSTPTSIPLATGTTATTTDPYVDDVNLGLQAYQSAYSNVNNYFQESTADASKLLDNNWKQQANMALNQLDAAATQLENIGDAPPEYEELDLNLMSMTSETHMLVQNYGNGINQLDPNAINNAANNLSNIASYLNSAVQELGQLTNP